MFICLDRFEEGWLFLLCASYEEQVGIVRSDLNCVQKMEKDYQCDHTVSPFLFLLGSYFCNKLILD